MKVLERVMGIEPTLVAWEATVLPLNYTRARIDKASSWQNSRALLANSTGPDAALEVVDRHGLAAGIPRAPRARRSAGALHRRWQGQRRHCAGAAARRDPLHG